MNIGTIHRKKKYITFIKEKTWGFFPSHATFQWSVKLSFILKPSTGSVAVDGYRRQLCLLACGAHLIALHSNVNETQPPCGLYASPTRTVVGLDRNTLTKMSASSCCPDGYRALSSAELRELLQNDDKMDQIIQLNEKVSAFSSSTKCREEFAPNCGPSSSAFNDAVPGVPCWSLFYMKRISFSSERSHEMLSVEDKSALLVSSIVCVARGGISGLDWGFSTDLQRTPGDDFQHQAYTHFSRVCPARLPLNASALEASLCVVVYAWKSLSKKCKFTVSHRVSSLRSRMRTRRGTNSMALAECTLRLNNCTH